MLQDIANGAWIAACLAMIRNADSLPFWADVAVTGLGLIGIILVVVMSRSDSGEASE